MISIHKASKLFPMRISRLTKRGGKMQVERKTGPVGPDEPVLTLGLSKNDEKILLRTGKVFVRSDNGNADYRWFEIGVTFRGKKK
jgi:hypothetical protein